MTALDREGRSELHYAALEGRTDQARQLLAAGADVTLADRNGLTPLHFAAQQHHVEIAQTLLDAGALVDATDKHGNTPLCKAVFASEGRGDLIALLREAGADPRLANKHGTSPLQLAERIGNYNVAQHFADLRA